MSGTTLGFILWAIVGGLIICLGIYALFSKKAVGFWANASPFPVKDIRGYNRATGTLLICYGAVFILLGLPLSAGQNNPYLLLSVLGAMLESIALMAIYSLVIEKKYRE